MKYKNLNLLVLFAAFIVFSVSAYAQTNGQAAVKAMPFNPGEVLVYEGKFSKIIQGIPVADLTFTVTNAPSGDDYLIKSEAKSKGSLLKLFRFSFLQQFESTVDNEAFRILKTYKHDEQKERVRSGEAVFDYQERQVTYIETDPKEPMRPPRRIASELKEDTHDLVSGVYALRMLPLAVGKVFEITVSDSGLVYKVPVRVTAREMQKTVLGRRWCYRIEPEVFGPDRLIEQEGSMTIWITDDARRIPVRSQIKSEIGKIEVKLKQVSYSKDVSNTSAKK